MAKAARKEAAFDPRLTLARDDLAAASLKGQVAAARFAEPQPMTVQAPVAPLRDSPDADAPLSSVLLYGESFEVLDVTEGWAWGQSPLDGYVGYLPAATLGEAGAAATHRIAMPLVHLYHGPGIKTEPVGALCMGALVAVAAFEGDFARLDSGFYLYAPALIPAESGIADVAATAQMFLHTPYLWGGRSVQGIDCSGLVQIALQRAGLACPRDSDMQEAGLGAAVDPDGALKRGDLVFWPGHVGMMIGAAKMIHANQHHMRVTVEPLANVRHRIREMQGHDMTSVKRIAGR